MFSSGTPCAPAGRMGPPMKYQETPRNTKKCQEMPKVREAILPIISLLNVSPEGTHPERGAGWAKTAAWAD